MFREREIRLRSDAAHFYLHIPPGESFPAARMSDAVGVLHLKRREATDYLGQRALEPEHFGFRYDDSGSNPSRPHDRRATDQALG
jgi:hypothetical protein